LGGIKIVQRTSVVKGKEKKTESDRKRANKIVDKRRSSSSSKRRAVIDVVRKEKEKKKRMTIDPGKEDYNHFSNQQIMMHLL